VGGTAVTRIFQRGVFVALATLAALVGRATAQQAPAAGAGNEHPLRAAIRLAEQSRDAANELKDYRALFDRREVVRGRMHASQMQMKFRTEPFSVYLRFVNPENAGREVLYVEGRNNNQMLAREKSGLKSLVGTVSLDPNGEMALAEARYPVTRIGLANLAEGVIQQWEKEAAYGETEVKYYPEAKLGDRAAIVIESTHPVRRPQFRSALTRLWIDKETRLPVRVQQYDFPATPGGQPVLVEDYTYTQIEPNVGLTDLDFDPRNPQYQF
jgi:hypothetical protein